jgi:hypothetical protein
LTFFFTYYLQKLVGSKGIVHEAEADHIGPVPMAESEPVPDTHGRVLERRIFSIGLALLVVD